MAKKQLDDGTEVDAPAVDETAEAVVAPVDHLGRDVHAEWPVGLMVGAGVESSWIGEFEYAVDPVTGLVTGRL